MAKTIKFTISMPAGEFKELEAIRRKAGKTRSQFVREAVRAWEYGEGKQSADAAQAATGAKEDFARYREPETNLPELTDVAEHRRRAIAAAGRFRSGVADLSTNHDKFLEDGFTTGAESEPLPEPEPGEKS